MPANPIPPALRLQASRERLRDAMTPPPPPPAPPTPPPNSFQRWLISLRNLPVVGEAAEAVGAWWVRHPFRPVAAMATEASSAAIAPVAQRHPLALVGAAAAAGAVLLWTRPWKWALRSVLFAGLVPQLASKVMKKLPIESWLTLLGTMLATRPKAASTVVTTPGTVTPTVRAVAPRTGATAVPAQPVVVPPPVTSVV